MTVDLNTQRIVLIFLSTSYLLKLGVVLFLTAA